LWLDHRFTDNLEGQLSYFHFSDLREAQTTELFNARRVDVNRLLPNGQTNPKFGVPFSEAAVGRQPQHRTVDEIRALASIRLATNWAGLDLRQRFTVVGGRRWFDHVLRSYFQRWVNNPATTDLTQSVNVTRYWLYWDEPRRYPLMPLPRIPGVDIQYRQIFFNQNNYDTLDYAQLVSNTTLWNERVSLIGGIRYDAFNRGTNTAVQTPTGANFINPDTVQTGNAVTYSSGAVVYPFKTQRWVGAYFNFSQNFAPPSAGLPRFDGTPFGPTRGQGLDYGLRFNLLGGRIYATVNRYESEQTDRIVGTNAGALPRNLARLWRINH
jgi:outer membrane receptor protein involved in Fe transport